jgi:hypothetical protein
VGAGVEAVIEATMVAAAIPNRYFEKFFIINDFKDVTFYSLEANFLLHCFVVNLHFNLFTLQIKILPNWQNCVYGNIFAIIVNKVPLSLCGVNITLRRFLRKVN